MLKLTRFRGNQLAYLVAAVLLSMACRQLVLGMVHVGGMGAITRDSLHKTSRQYFGRQFLDALNCQSLQPGEKDTGHGPGTATVSPFEEAAFFRGMTAQTAPPDLEKRSFPPAAPTPLRI